jgi:putative membrane protein
MKNTISLLLKGMAMGMAEVVPGVSGGTIAFITGIYETLIRTIKSVLSPEPWRKLLREGIPAAWDAANGGFLFALLAGMVLGIVAGVFGISYLLEHFPPIVWAFFFGLIIASAIYISRQVSRWTPQVLAALVFGILVSYFITQASPAQGPESWWFVFLSGMVAISALILPGISGSFILLLLGMYTLVIGTVKSVLETFAMADVLLLAVFALGCLFGLATFSRVLSWLFARHRELTLAGLTGFMIGSLPKIWPWRNVVQYRTNSSGEQVPFLEDNVLPAVYAGEPYLLWAVLAGLAGFGLVFALEALDRAYRTT